MELKNILVPIDGSKQSQNALAAAIKIARLYNASLTLLNIIVLDKQISPFEQVSTGGYIPSELTGEGYQLLATFMQAVPHELTASIKVEIGEPSKTIIDLCEANNYDLIVMGRRGLGTFKQLLLGSVSQYVLENSDIPVMIVQ